MDTQTTVGTKADSGDGNPSAAPAVFWTAVFWRVQHSSADLHPMPPPHPPINIKNLLAGWAMWLYLISSPSWLFPLGKQHEFPYRLHTLVVRNLMTCSALQPSRIEQSSPFLSLWSHPALCSVSPTPFVCWSSTTSSSIRSPQVFWSTCLFLSSTITLEQSALLSPPLFFH